MFAKRVLMHLREIVTVYTLPICRYIWKEGTDIHPEPQEDGGRSQKGWREAPDQTKKVLHGI